MGLPLYSETTAGFYFFRQTSFEKKRGLNIWHDKKLVLNTVPRKDVIHQTENLEALFRCIYPLSCLIGVAYIQTDLFLAQWSVSSMNFQAAIFYFSRNLPKYFMIHKREKIGFQTGMFPWKDLNKLPSPSFWFLDPKLPREMTSSFSDWGRDPHPMLPTCSGLSVC